MRVLIFTKENIFGNLKTKNNMEANDVLWFFIFLIISCAIVWAAGSFIAWDMLWFIHSVVGRIFGIILFIACISSAVKNVEEF
jgi:type VI protein secretion system component VasK